MLVLEKQKINEIVGLLKKGEIIIFPTETSYGLGCDANSQTAVDKIFTIKGRPNSKPLLVVVPSVKMAKKYLHWNKQLEKISQKYWPGPLTVVGEYCRSFWHKNLARGVVGADNTVAIRVTGDEFLKTLLTKFSRPLVATSANVAGQGEIYDSAVLTTAFNAQPIQPDVLIAGGKLKPVSPTTIVSVTNNELKILRQGGVKIE